jgi:acetyltransferase-like isoleucine patch superfamily enzyme
VNIIENTIIGMGSIVTKDILQNGTYVGNPIYKL